MCMGGGGGGGGGGGDGKNINKKVNWSFSELFFFNISRKKTVKLVR